MVLLPLLLLLLLLLLRPVPVLPPLLPPPPAAAALDAVPVRSWGIFRNVVVVLVRSPLSSPGKRKMSILLMLRGWFFLAYRSVPVFAWVLLVERVVFFEVTGHWTRLQETKSKIKIFVLFIQKNFLPDAVFAAPAFASEVVVADAAAAAVAATVAVVSASACASASSVACCCYPGVSSVYSAGVASSGRLPQSHRRRTAGVSFWAERHPDIKVVSLLKIPNTPI